MGGYGLATPPAEERFEAPDEGLLEVLKMPQEQIEVASLLSSQPGPRVTGCRMAENGYRTDLTVEVPNVPVPAQLLSVQSRW